MLISRAKIFNNPKGFSLIEILVALALVGLMTVIGIQNFTSSKEVLEETVFELDRAVRYSLNEAILRNAIVRLKINLDAQPNEYTVEYGKSSDLVLPETVDMSKLSIKDREYEFEKQKKLENQFSVTTYFEDGPKPFSDLVYFYGIGSSYQDTIMTEGEVSLYFYPSGEKDSAVIFFHNGEEMVSLKIPSFEELVYDDYYTFNQQEMDFIDDALEKQARDVFSQWLRE